MADTITLKDGKWNFSKFQFYEYITSGKELVKIANDKTISDVIISDADMVANEFYTENTKDNIEKYNKGEYAFAYVKADKLYYGYIMKGMLEFIGDTEGPTDPTDPEEPTDPDFSQTEYEKNIKSQTEYVENNNLKLSKAFTEINTELEKDDDLIANDLFDVDKCIEELKKSRKKWATGGSANYNHSEEMLDLRNVGFEISSLYVYHYMDANAWAQYVFVVNFDSNAHLLSPTHLYKRNGKWYQAFADSGPREISDIDNNAFYKKIMRLKSEKRIEISVGSNSMGSDMIWYAFE